MVIIEYHHMKMSGNVPYTVYLIKVPVILKTLINVEVFQENIFGLSKLCSVVGFFLPPCFYWTFNFLKMSI